MMTTGGYHAERMAKDGRSRISLSLSDDEVAQVEQLAAEVPLAPTTWATSIVQRYLRARREGAVSAELTPLEDDLIRALRRLSREPGSGAEAIVGLVGMSLASPEVRRRALALAVDIADRIESPHENGQ